MNCFVAPSAMLGLGGSTAMDCSVAAVTPNIVEPETPAKVAVILLLPTASGVAKPLEFAALLIVAVTVLEELQVTVEVISFFVLSEYIPVAVNCFVAPSAIL